MDPIKFYSTQDEYGEFSNFALYPIKLKKKNWPTSEHYFQAQKFLDTQYREKIRKATSPMLAARLGRTRKVRIRRDWERVRNSVMFDAIQAKFTQHAGLQQLLLSTDDRKLIEHTDADDYWGDGGGGGSNMLGEILMQVRMQLRDKRTD